jgi:hypothetical protein
MILRCHCCFFVSFREVLLGRTILSFGKAAGIAPTAPLSLQPQRTTVTLSCIRYYAMWGNKLLIRQGSKSANSGTRMSVRGRI